MSKKKRLIESGKTLLILGLILSAAWLVGQSRLVHVFGGVLGQGSQGQENAAVTSLPAQTVRPVGMAANNESGCCGAQYTDEEPDALYERVAPLLNEALSSAGTPVKVSGQVWEKALQATPGIYFDFLGDMPLQVLAGWLSGRENTNLTARARQLILAADGDSVQLYYRNREDDTCWACPVDVVSLSRLQTAVSEVTANGAFFACQSEEYRALAPDTLISHRTPSPGEYTAANPLQADKDDRLDELLEALSFPVGITAIYDTPEGRRARSGNDTLSIGEDGVVTYHTTDGGARYPVVHSAGSGALFAAVESARQLVWPLLSDWSGEARLYLAGVENLGDDSWRVNFDYQLDGIPVRLSGGYAAGVVVEHGNITQYELRLRTYTRTQSSTLLLPEEQAVAVLTHLGQAGGRLQLSYQDSGETVRAGWLAVPQ